MKQLVHGIMTCRSSPAYLVHEPSRTVLFNIAMSNPLGKLVLLSEMFLYFFINSNNDRASVLVEHNLIRAMQSASPLHSPATDMTLFEEAENAS